MDLHKGVFISLDSVQSNEMGGNCEPIDHKKSEILTKEKSLRHLEFSTSDF